MERLTWLCSSVHTTNTSRNKHWNPCGICSNHRAWNCSGSSQTLASTTHLTCLLQQSVSLPFLSNKPSQVAEIIPTAEILILLPKTGWLIRIWESSLKQGHKQLATSQFPIRVMYMQNWQDLVNWREKISQWLIHLAFHTTKK